MSALPKIGGQTSFTPSEPQICLNCGIPTAWGDFCVDCVRAFVSGACSALAVGLVTWLLKK